MSAIRPRKIAVASGAALAVALTAAVWAAPARADVPRNASLPAVSPDGRRIAFVAGRGDSVWQVYVVNADGSGTARLTSSREDKYTPSWSTDGSWVHYQSDRGDTCTLSAVPLEGGAAKVVVSMNARTMALSHDGRRLAYAVGTWSRNRLWVSALDGSGARAITDSSAAYFNLAWSPDGARIAVARSDSTGAMQVWVMGADGSGAQALTRFTPGEARPQWPAWSRDGRKVAVQAGIYDRDDPGKSTAHILVFDVASGNATWLAKHAEPRLDETPSWFPDGKRLAFQSDRSGRMEIWIMNADGTRPRQVTR
jgi:Tol biopolymer transport system component